jgi:haloalkane dehalogenase
MGRSDKPDIPYRFFDHVKYVEGFIEALSLENVTLVIHDWGSALGFHYACRNEANIKGIAFMEAIWRPVSWEVFPGKYKVGFKLFRTPIIGWFLIAVLNGFVRQILPQTIVRNLSDKEMARYAEPFPTWRSRRPVRRWPCEIPIDGQPADVHQVVSSYHKWLLKTEVPKLFLFATPGAIIPSRDAPQIEQQFKNIVAVDIGRGVHFVQEDQPYRIGSELSEWYSNLS